MAVMITRFNPPFRPDTPSQWRGACAAVAGGGPNRATAIAVARLAFTITGPTRGFTTLRLIDLVAATHRHLNELAMLEYALQRSTVPTREREESASTSRPGKA